MRLATVMIGCLVLLTSCITYSVGLSESLMFAELVDIQLSNYSSCDECRSLPYVLNHQSLPRSHVYGIVIDAGSTGTRIHVYKFAYGSRDNDNVYNLVEEAIKEVRPGLSSYAKDPPGIRPGLLKLFRLAHRRVPLALIRLTHVTVRATAGLRLLPPDESASLLKEARECVESSGFVVDRVDVMDGVEEAVQAWVTVNYLLRRLHLALMHSVGVMDLGGASTQITFVPGEPGTLASVPAQHRQTLNVTGSLLDVYTHSYLGLGLMSARMAILRATGDNTSAATHISSPCLPHKYQGHWTHNHVRYSINSTAAHNDSHYDQCYNASRWLVTERVPVVHMAELRQRRFYLFSYFYDRVKDTGIEPDQLPRGQISVADYRRLAMAACSSNNTVSQRKPFLCLDLVYIYALLKDGYRLQLSTSFYLAKKINNIELGWALGAVFDLLYRTELV